jgi:carbon-monoxide dehydrogenase large subunit
VRFVGERVAAVAAVDPDVAEAALDLIDVEYDPLPALDDPLLAMGPGAPLLHPAFDGYEGHGEPSDLPNVQSHWGYQKGNPATGFAAADVVLAQRFTTPSIHQAHLEPHACLVAVQPDGTIAVWTSTQSPYIIRRCLAQYLDLPEARVRVMPCPVGGGFGAKAMLIDEPLAYYLSCRAGGRPVKMVMTAAEEFQASNPRHASVLDARLGATREGSLVAFELRAVYDGGAYASFKPIPTLPGVGNAAACYAIPHVAIEAYCVYTTSAPGGYMRGPGGLQATFAAESIVDQMALALALDPAELRRRNVVGDGHVPLQGEPWQDVKARECLERAVAAARWDERPTGAAAGGARRGRGIALVEKHIGSGESGCYLEVEPDGTVLLTTGVTDVGTGAHTILAQIVAEELGIAPADVVVNQTDTDGAPFDSGSGASRVTVVAGQATRLAAVEVRQQLVAAAAAALECPPELVRVEGGAVFAAERPEQRLSLADVARIAVERTGQALQAAGQRALQPTHEPTFGCQVVELEVDPETGQVRLLRLDAVYDVGVAINPALVEAQVHGGIGQGVGAALSEELRRDDGRVANPNFGEYKLPTIQDLPPAISVALLEGGDSPGPYSAKSVGEIVILPAAPAIANAIFDAVGVRIVDLPITAERVRTALRSRASPAADE